MNNLVPVNEQQSACTFICDSPESFQTNLLTNSINLKKSQELHVHARRTKAGTKDFF